MTAEHPQAREIRRYKWLLSATHSAARVFFTFWLLSGQVFGYGKAMYLAIAITLVTDNIWLQSLGYMGALSAAYFVIGFPFMILSGYVLPRHYGLSHQTLDDWFLDLLKGGLVGVCIGSIVVTALTALLVYTGSNWWWLTAIAGTVFSILLTRIAPQVLIPIFFKMQPLSSPNGERIQARFRELARRFGTPVLGIFEINLSRRTNAANAAVVGFGKSRRALVGDTLLKNFPEEEVEFVLAHELAHHKHHDLWRGVALGCIVLFTTLGLTHVALSKLAPELNLVFPIPSENAFSPVLLFWISLLTTVIGLFTMPIERAVSRKMETRADEFAAIATNNPAAGANAFARLGFQNRAVFKPPLWEELLLFTHPSLQRRIDRLNQFAIKSVETADQPQESV